MRAILVQILYFVGFVFWLATLPFLALGQVALWVVRPLRWVSERSVDKAREWDVRLADRDQPLDSRPPYHG